MAKIELDDGKYTVIVEPGTEFRALRYGEPWRDLTGDKLVLALCFRIEELEEQLADIDSRAQDSAIERP